MAYKKPEIVAQNGAGGTYAAACPPNDRCPECVNCERTS